LYGARGTYFTGRGARILRSKRHEMPETRHTDNWERGTNEPNMRCASSRAVRSAQYPRPVPIGPVRKHASALRARASADGGAAGAGRSRKAQKASTASGSCETARACAHARTRTRTRTRTSVRTRLCTRTHARARTHQAGWSVLRDGLVAETGSGSMAAATRCDPNATCQRSGLQHIAACCNTVQHGWIGRVGPT
jgi:hypothetical protein